jgi:hypothetical protein
MYFFPPKPQNKEKLPRYYRNPIFIAKEYKTMFDAGEVKNQFDLAEKLGVSRARVCQVLSLLKLNTDLIDAIEKIGNPSQHGLSQKERYENA